MEKEKLIQILNNRPRQSIDRTGLRPAGVLLPLFRKNDETHILLTKRTEKVDQHKGQISFPGGAFSVEDMDCLTTALRETEEEIGIEMDLIEVLGELDQVVTMTDFRICPYVGIIPYPYPFKLSPFEVDRLIELPLDYLLEHAEVKETTFTLQGKPFVNLVLDYQGDIIWGATARILKNFMDILMEYP